MMQEKRIVLMQVIMLFVFMLFGGRVSAEEMPVWDINGDGKTGLAEAVGALQIAAGVGPVAAMDVSGTWDVQSQYADGTVKKGRVLLSQDAAGLINGEALLTSLPGESALTGQLNGQDFTLALTTDAATMIAKGTLSPDGQTASGTFDIETFGLFDIPWTGEKISSSFGEIQIQGPYAYEPQHQCLYLMATNYAQNYLRKLVVPSMTQTEMTTIDDQGTDDTADDEEILWTRTSGSNGNVVGEWIAKDKPSMHLEFADDGNFVLWEHY